MAEKIIEFENLWKKYGDKIALRNLNFFINENEFFILFGPSGAGKTTTLKIISGLEFISAGNIKISGRISNFVSPQERDARMVFENYALYPHLNVFENLASPLRIKKYSEEEIKKAVSYTAQLLGMGDYLERLPRELSGGQKQRVALGRALVIKSKIYLLDEPLAHLDAKIRNQLRAEFHNIKSFLSSGTVVYVTHDYLEAISLGDRICVLNNGNVEQIGTPKEIYYEPINSFVSNVFGQPQINLLNLDINYRNSEIYLEEKDFSLKLNKKYVDLLNNYNKKKIILGIRPQFFNFYQQKQEDDFIRGIVKTFDILNYKGVALIGIGNLEITILSENYEEIKENRDIWIKVMDDHLLFFDIDTGINLKKVSKGVKDSNGFS